MILPVNSINTNYKTNSIKKSKSADSTNLSKPLKSDLSGVPISYISFGSTDVEKQTRKEQERREKIAKYLQFWLWNPNEDEFYAKKAEKEIQDLKESRSYSIFGKEYLGKVKKSEQLNIKEDFRKKYLKDKETFKEIEKNQEYYEGLIKTDEIEVYEKTKELLKNKPNALDNTIAGYKKEKEQMKKLLIEPILRETALNTVEKIPAAVLIYGAARCGKSEMSKAIAQESGCNIISIENVHPRVFLTKLLNSTRAAKENYKIVNEENQYISGHFARNLSVDKKAELIVNRKSPRTIIIIDDVDKYFNPDVEGNNKEIAENNKTILKGILDHCSEKPSGEYSDDAAGTTFIFTSNYPTLVDSEISLRKGKCSKMSVSVPNDDDIKDILKFYMEKQNPKISKLIDKGKDIERIDLNELPLNSYEKIIQPSASKGAISGAGIKMAVEEAAEKYFANPDESIALQIPTLLSSRKFRIPPEKLEEYKREIEKMGILDKEIDEKEEYELLKEAKELEMLQNNQKKRFQALSEIYN